MILSINYMKTQRNKSCLWDRQRPSNLNILHIPAPCDRLAWRRLCPVCRTEASSTMRIYRSWCDSRRSILTFSLYFAWHWPEFRHQYSPAMFKRCCFIRTLNFYVFLTYFTMFDTFWMFVSFEARRASMLPLYQCLECFVQFWFVRLLACARALEQFKRRWDMWDLRATKCHDYVLELSIFYHIFFLQRLGTSLRMVFTRQAAQCLARLTDGASRDFQITLASAAVKQEDCVNCPHGSWESFELNCRNQKWRENETLMSVSADIYSQHVKVTSWNVWQEQVLRTLKASQAAIRWSWSQPSELPNVHASRNRGNWERRTTLRPLAVALMLCCSNPEAWAAWWAWASGAGR